MVRYGLFLLIASACGGQVTGPLEGDGGPSDAGGHCTKNADCPTGESCGFAESAGCSATGQCFPVGAICNGFQPGCSCAGQPVNLICNGLPNGYTTAPVESTQACPSEASTGPQFPCGTTFCAANTQFCSNGTTCVPSNGCTTCTCVQALVQCSSTCKQVADAIYVQCQ